MGPQSSPVEETEAGAGFVVPGRREGGGIFSPPWDRRPRCTFQRGSWEARHSPRRFPRIPARHGTPGEGPRRASPPEPYKGRRFTISRHFPESQRPWERGGRRRLRRSCRGRRSRPRLAPPLPGGHGLGAGAPARGASGGSAPRGSPCHGIPGTRRHRAAGLTKPLSDRRPWRLAA